MNGRLQSLSGSWRGLSGAPWASAALNLKSTDLGLLHNLMLALLSEQHKKKVL